MCRFHQPWRSADRGGPKQCSSDNCTFKHADSQQEFDKLASKKKPNKKSTVGIRSEPRFAGSAGIAHDDSLACFSDVPVDLSHNTLPCCSENGGEAEDLAHERIQLHKAEESDGDSDSESVASIDAHTRDPTLKKASLQAGLQPAIDTG